MWGHVKSLKVGDAFGNYIITRLIGCGGMGVVYLVRHIMLDTYHALKILTPGKLSHDALNVERFMREAKFACQLKHPNLIEIHDAGYHASSDSYYIIMDYVPGGSLRELMFKMNRLPLANALQIVTQITQALCVAYDHDIVHRDLKPDNIMFTATGEAKLADLGIAKCVNNTMTTITMNLAAVGTPSYMSPEQARDAAKVDARTDIYSLGILFYEMLAGERPYGDAAIVELVTKLISPDPIPDIRTHCPDLPVEIVRLIEDMTAKNPDDRISSPHDLLVRLSQIQVMERPQMLPIQVKSGHVKLALGTRDVKMPLPHHTRRNRVRRMRWFVIVGAILLALGLLSLIGFHVVSHVLNSNATMEVAHGEDDFEKYPLCLSIPISPSVNLDLIKVKCGSFNMGTPPNITPRDRDEFVHQITITKDFYIGKFEVTQAQYEAVLGQNPARHKKGGLYPVESVTWEDACNFCNELNLKYRDKIPAGYHFTLPTEAQWEYAARGGMNSLHFKYAGSDVLDEVAWYDMNAERATHPVGGKHPNELGLYDMSGNVAEWCRDWYNSNFYKDNQVDPVALSGIGSRVMRGGAFNLKAALARTADRYKAVPTNRFRDIGFRVVLERVLLKD